MKNTWRPLRNFLSDPSRLVDALIVFVPIALVLAWVGADATAIFITSALGIIPLAGILGEATDALAHRAGAHIGALLNATFGNAAELIITITAIRAGLLEVVKAYHRLDHRQRAARAGAFRFRRRLEAWLSTLRSPQRLGQLDDDGDCGHRASDSGDLRAGD
jgi:Ca2+/H+ antiporter